jgi:hypothetical protein
MGCTAVSKLYCKNVGSNTQPASPIFSHHCLFSIVRTLSSVVVWRDNQGCVDVGWSLQLPRIRVPKDYLADGFGLDIQLLELQFRVCMLLAIRFHEWIVGPLPLVNHASAGLSETTAPTQFSTAAACFLISTGRVIAIGASWAAGLRASLLYNTRVRCAGKTLRFSKPAGYWYPSTTSRRVKELTSSVNRYWKSPRRATVLFIRRFSQSPSFAWCTFQQRPQLHTQLVSAESMSPSGTVFSDARGSMYQKEETL